MAEQARSEDREAISGQLNSWKEIAAYLGREVRTIQRWEKEEGLPVHRHLHSKRSSVYAFPGELDDWWRSRRALLTPPADAEASNGKSGAKLHSRRLRIWLIASIALAVVGTAWLLSSHRESRQDPSPAIPLTVYPGHEFSPAFSPDGDQIAFAWNGQDRYNFDIYVKQIGSYAPQRLSNHPNNEYSPAWSPDGSTIAFLRDLDGGRAGVFLMPSRGGPETHLTDTSGPFAPGLRPEPPAGFPGLVSRRQVARDFRPERRRRAIRDTGGLRRDWRAAQAHFPCGAFRRGFCGVVLSRRIHDRVLPVCRLPGQ